MPSSPSRPPAAEEVSDAEMSDGEVPPRHAAESVGGGATNRAAPGSAGEEDEEIYDDDESSDYNSYDDDDDSDESGSYYEDGEEEEEGEGAGEGRASGSAEEAALAGVGGCAEAEAEGSPRAADTCCICMDPWASYGAHRICCIPCGHVYGRSCLERWLRRGGNTSAKCPQCSERFKYRHIINLYSTVHLWNDCCLKEIRAQSTSSTSSVHPRPHAISFRISQLEARMEEERRLREEAVRRQKERIAAQNQFFEERMAAQNQFFEERMSQAIKESRAAQNQHFEERMAAQSQFFKEQRAAQRQDFEESRAAQRQDFEESRASQNQFIEERLAAQSQAFDERMSQAIKENSAAQIQAFEERLAALSQAIEERISQGIKERLEAERALYQEQFQSPYALHDKSPPSMPSLPPPRARHTHMHLSAGSNDLGGGTSARDQGSPSTHHGGGTPTSRN